MILAVLASAGPAFAEGGELQRLALVAGASNGGAGRAVLRYAVSDARAVAGVLGQLGGVEPADLVLLEEPDADALRGALARLGQEAVRIRAAGRRPELFLYYSGHSDEQGLLLGPSRLPYAELRQALEAVPAQVRVAVLDSCASGAFTRSKGGVHRPPFLVDASSQLQGHAFLTSSAADEASQESDRLGASYFTHALLTGLRGAADASGDGVVTLSEAYQFAFQETLARTEATRSGPQHATYDIGLVGSGDVVLTDLHRATTVLALPEPLGGRLFVRDGAGRLVAELHKHPGARVDLALEAGGYQVRLVRDRRASQGTVLLATASRTVLDETRLQPVPLEATASRGAEEPALAEAPASAQPAPPASPGGLVGRHGLALTLGLHGSTGGVTTGPDGVTAGGTAGFLGGLSYTTWFSEHWAGSLSVTARTLDGEVTVTGGTTTTRGSVVVPIVLSARYLLPLAGDPVRLHAVAELGAGAWFGATGGVSAAPGGSLVSSHSETRPGARLGAGLDYLASEHLLLAAGVGYSQVADYSTPIGGRRNASGVDAGLSLGVVWGGR
jgi:hypothetical protein